MEKSIEKQEKGVNTTKDAMSEEYLRKCLQEIIKEFISLGLETIEKSKNEYKNLFPQITNVYNAAYNQFE